MKKKFSSIVLSILTMLVTAFLLTACGGGRLEIGLPVLNPKPINIPASGIYRLSSTNSTSLNVASHGLSLLSSSSVYDCFEIEFIEGVRFEMNGQPVSNRKWAEEILQGEIAHWQSFENLLGVRYERHIAQILAEDIMNVIDSGHNYRDGFPWINTIRLNISNFIRWHSGWMENIPYITSVVRPENVVLGSALFNAAISHSLPETLSYGAYKKLTEHFANIDPIEYVQSIIPFSVQRLIASFYGKDNFLLCDSLTMSELILLEILYANVLPHSLTVITIEENVFSQQVQIVMNGQMLPNPLTFRAPFTMREEDGAILLWMPDGTYIVSALDFSVDKFSLPVHVQFASHLEINMIFTQL